MTDRNAGQCHVFFLRSVLSLSSALTVEISIYLTDRNAGQCHVFFLRSVLSLSSALTVEISAGRTL